MKLHLHGQGWNKGKSHGLSHGPSHGLSRAASSSTTGKQGQTSHRQQVQVQAADGRLGWRQGLAHAGVVSGHLFLSLFPPCP